MLLSLKKENLGIVILDKTIFPYIGLKENVETPYILFIFQDRIEIITMTLKPDKTVETHIRTFDYNDLLLMNNTLNLIMGRNSK